MNTFTQKISPLQSDAIKKELEALNASFDTVQYAFWRAKTDGFQAIYYTSGKLLIQGKDIDYAVKRLEGILNTSVMSETTEIKSQVPTGEKYIGTDESGKGDFFGPLVIAGVLADETNSKRFIDEGIKDSKKLDDKKILKLAGIIKANAVHSVIVIMPQKYNELYCKFNNLNKLLAWGHARAIENILEKSRCDYALADKFGDESLIQNALMKNGQKITLKQEVRAEANIGVAAASVLARAEFVKRIDELSSKYESDFSKGVSENVKSQARDFIKKYSYDRLNEVAKIHFKTAKELH